ncbi:MAG: hypothetical protein IJK67_01760 [Bacilli bacterium]|nr:hypothetical protein [Bacilli bacterium]
MKKKLIYMIFEIDVIIFCMYIVTLLISSLFSNVSVLKYDVVSSNKDIITIVSARSGDISKTIDIKKKFYINADENNQISALKTNGGKIIYIPNYLYNYKGVLSGLVLSTVSLFIIFVFITFYILFRLAKKRSELKLVESC